MSRLLLTTAALILVAAPALAQQRYQAQPPRSGFAASPGLLRPQGPQLAPRPGGGLISNNQGGLISNNRGGIITDHAAGFRR